MKRLKWPAVLLAILLSACQLPMGLPPTATAAPEQALVTGAPSPTSTVVGAARPVQTTPRSPATPLATATAEGQETATPTPALVEMGRLYFTGFAWYGWYDLVAQEKGQELIRSYLINRDVKYRTSDCMRGERWT